uniref:IgLON family member 5 n=1 Tax=Laticauda laticaudata TaxID=8630 RepID=A0A8C5SJJ1_LATLA
MRSKMFSKEKKQESPDAFREKNTFGTTMTWMTETLHRHSLFLLLPPLLYSCYIDQQVTRVAWLNRSNILYAGNDKWSIDLRVQLLQYSPSEFSIMISHVDVYDEGLYTCSFQTQDKPHTSQVYLIVHVPARIVNISSAVTVNEGSNVNLLCLAVGKPEPTVIWRQLKDGFTSEGEYLEISEINREQAGEYECITANGVSTQDSKHVLITVNYPPIITDVKDSRPLIGKTALLRCEAMAVPAAEFQWFKDDKHRLISGSDGLQIQNERTRSILLFTNVTTRHYGNYTCLASNSLGSYNEFQHAFTQGGETSVCM